MVTTETFRFDNINRLIIKDARKIRLVSASGSRHARVWDVIRPHLGRDMSASGAWCVRIWGGGRCLALGMDWRIDFSVECACRKSKKGWVYLGVGKEGVALNWARR